MQNDGPNRRSFLKTVSSAGMLAALPEAAFGLHAGGGNVIHEIAEPAQDAEIRAAILRLGEAMVQVAKDSHGTVPHHP